MFESEVFNRTSTNCKEINSRLYNIVIGLTLFWGFAVNWFMVSTIPVETLEAINIWVFLGGYFISCIIGCIMFNSSDNPLISFIGYNLVVVPFGLVLTLFLKDYSQDAIIHSMQVTTMITIGMMILGTIFPKFFQKISGALFAALLLAIIVELVMIFVWNQKAPIMDWIVILIFCGYIGYDWGRANAIPKTVDNAIDSAAALYMDIINIFVRHLSATGND